MHSARIPSLTLLRRPALILLLSGFVPSFLSSPAEAKDRWTELNIGPYYLSTNGDLATARDALTQLEQLRWVLGNLLEEKELKSLWPIRIMLLARPEGGADSRRQELSSPGAVVAQDEFVSQFGQYLRVTAPSEPLPLGAVAGLLLTANTPRLPLEVESGVRQLFSTLEARGSRVSWGGAPAHPDLAWARMQLFATKFEYSASFHIFLAALRSGSTITAAERNAFGKSSAALETEAQANLAAGHWSAVPVSGRPLDPKRDFGEHSLDDEIAELFLASASRPLDRNRLSAASKAAVEHGDAAAPLGYEAQGELARANRQDPKVFWDNAVRAGSHNAKVYVAAAEGLPAVDALPLLKRAAQINDRWAEPIYRQAQLADTPAEKEALLKTVLKLDPRATSHWIELAQLQTAAGEGTAAQGSWLRAEDSAPTDVERDRVHQLRLSYEQQRLDAAEAARRQDRDAVHLADQQAQQAQADRVHAAEQKANESLAKSPAGEKAAEVVDWNSLAGEKKLSGTLTRVDCLKAGWRLSLRDKSAKVVELLLPKDMDARLVCGPLNRPRRVSLTYRPSPDNDLHTVGEVISLELP